MGWKDTSRKIVDLFVELPSNTSPIEDVTHAVVSSSRSSIPERHLGKHHTTNIAFGVLLGIAIVFLFGLFPEKIATIVTGKRLVDHVMWWELGAILWNGIFAILVYCECPPTSKVNLDKVINLLLILVAIISVLAAHSLYVERTGVFLPAGTHPLAGHMEYVLLVALILLLTDWLLAFHLTDGEPRKKEFQDLCFLLDLPMVFGIVTIDVCQYLNGSDPQMQAFLGGAISFGLLAQNAIFVILHWKVFPQRDYPVMWKVWREFEQKLQQLEKKRKELQDQTEEVDDEIGDMIKDLSERFESLQKTVGAEKK